MEELQPTNNQKETLNGEITSLTNGKPYKRPLGLSILLIFSFVYNGFMFVVLGAGLFYNSIVRQIIEQYYPQVKVSHSTTFLLNFVGTMLFGISIFGLIKLWRTKRSGYYYFATSQIVILLTILVFLRSYDWINLAIATVVMIIIGLYAGKMR